ncbi:MAG: ribonuclease H [Coriobacteriaceae bacterium]|nr:ribonuclease H [Coriobacteriaceae bacterium]
MPDVPAPARGTSASGHRRAVSPHVLRTDGGSRGNPGPAAAAFVLEAPDGTILLRAGRFIGEATNNVAEYEALIMGLGAALALGVSSIEVLADSELLVRQVTGTYRVKHPNMRPLHARVTRLLAGFESWRIGHVRREQNVAADSLVNEALDTHSTVGDEVPDGTSAPGTQASLF